MEEQKEVKKETKLVTIIVIVALMIICWGGGWILGTKFADLEDKASNKEPEKTQTPEQTQMPEQQESQENLPIDGPTNLKIQYVLELAGDPEMFDYFKNGLTELSEINKHRLVYFAINKEGKIDKTGQLFTQEIVTKLGLNESSVGQEYYTAKISDFLEKYNYLFNNTINYSVINESFCPGPLAADEANDTIYFGSACGGAYKGVELNTPVITSDSTYYYARQEYTPYEEEKITLVWKFDKNAALISVEKQ